MTAADRARDAGRRACLAGEPFSTCPHTAAELRQAWRQGYEQAEVEQSDADGDLFRGTARS
jgi:ribosome modulation factor